MQIFQQIFLYLIIKQVIEVRFIKSQVNQISVWNKHNLYYFYFIKFADMHFMGYICSFKYNKT